MVCLCGVFLITFTQGNAIICLCDQLRCLPVLLTVPWAGSAARRNEQSLLPSFLQTPFAHFKAA